MTLADRPQLILVDPDTVGCERLAGRLRAQCYDVHTAHSAADAAKLALSAPPKAVVANLWMPSISGVQLCRLLKSEPATAGMPIILRAPGNAPRDRFWAEKAGAAAYVPKGRIGELVRALSRAIAASPPEDGFFTHLEQDVDIRDRIARQLDLALYDSVVASEVRALGTCEDFPRLFDLCSQFICQVTTYRWLALHVKGTKRLGLHCHPATRDTCEKEARQALDCPATKITALEDEDACESGSNMAILKRSIRFGESHIGSVALLPGGDSEQDHHLMDLLAAELGGPIRMASLVEDSQRLARYDPLTGIMNRRAFTQTLQEALKRCTERGENLSLLLLDVDHFKAVNDELGHAAGDAVLSALGELLAENTNSGDQVARWGGEEFVIGLCQVTPESAFERAEDLRAAIAALSIASPGVHTPIKVTASFGLAHFSPGDPLELLVDYADKAMYEAKIAGRNRVVVSHTKSHVPDSSRRMAIRTAANSD